ncbi:MAG: TA system antitoxin ParD family protein [Burkholderiaceae bacterium]
MSINVKLSKNLVQEANVFGRAEHRSVPKQIEHWSQIGKIAQENPNLPFSLDREIIIADQGPVIGESSHP